MSFRFTASGKLGAKTALRPADQRKTGAPPDLYGTLARFGTTGA
jgi:hypothetical protein